MSGGVPPPTDRNAHGRLTPTDAARPAVHAAAGRLGASHPRQEAPVDLRLVPPALAAWATTALLLDAPPARTAAVAVASLAAACVLMGPALRRRGMAGMAVTWPRATGAAVLAAVAASAASAGLHGADLRRGPVPELARQYATVTAEVEVTSDPRLTRPHVNGDHAAPPSVLIEGEVRRVEQPDGTEVTTRTPVLLLVDARASKTSRCHG